jgi:hypothetical protein
MTMVIGAADQDQVRSRLRSSASMARVIGALTKIKYGYDRGHRCC